MKKLVCPKCGEVSKYAVVMQCRQYVIYDAETDEMRCTINGDTFYTGKSKRCPNCYGKLYSVDNIELAIDDEVISRTGISAVITSVTEDNLATLLFADGSVAENIKFKDGYWSKTGRHVNISKVLDSLRAEGDDNVTST